MKRAGPCDFGRALGPRLAAYSISASLLIACGATNKDAPLRSPSLDYPPPAPRESDGRTMGADNIAPGERLEQGASAGTDNQLAPGWSVGDEQPLEYDPKKRTGGATDVEK